MLNVHDFGRAPFRAVKRNAKEEPRRIRRKDRRNAIARKRAFLAN